MPLAVERRFDRRPTVDKRTNCHVANDPIPAVLRLLHGPIEELRCLTVRWIRPILRLHTDAGRRNRIHLAVNRREHFRHRGVQPPEHEPHVRGFAAVIIELIGAAIGAIEDVAGYAWSGMDWRLRRDHRARTDGVEAYR